MRRWLRLVVLLAVVAGAIFFYLRRIENPRDPNLIRLSGNIEITQVELAFKIPGRLQERLVDEGQPVAADQVIARLDDADQRLRVDQAEAELAYAQAVVRELEAGSRPEEIRQAQALLAQTLAVSQAAKSRLSLAAKNEDRYRALLAEKVVSQRVYDESRTAYETAMNANAEALAQVARAQAANRLAQIGPRAETIDQARARASAVEKTLALAHRQLRDTVLKAPFGGVVMSKSAEPGAYLNPGAVVIALGRLDQVWLRAYIQETDLGRVKLNQMVQVRTDSFPDKVYSGRVSFVSDQAEFTPKSVQTFEERVKLMYRVKIALDNDHGELKPGMPADGLIVVAP
jgi:HlyD family secretion protein